MQIKGKVYFVGAGVGERAYLTLRAEELLSRAEVLVYDALVDPQLADLVPDECLKLYVGKRGGKVSTPQDKINQLLVAYCCQGKQVVRLKSGDPLVFGRSRGEIAALQRENCNFELIPGISSVLAAPLLAGIPLTDRELSSCFAVCSGHEIKQLNWQALAKIDTLVILMGTRSLPEIVTELIDQGKDAHEPVAIIRNCSQIGQEIFWGTLTDIVSKTRGISLSPAVIVIGKVVTLGDRINQTSLSSNHLPLANKTILVTRAAEQSSKFTTLLESQGATVREMPALVITAPSSWQDLDNAIANLPNFDWLILTSANGVKYFWSRLKDVRALAGVKIAVVGKKTAATLEQYNIQPDFIPPNFVADSLVETFPESLPGKKILFPRVENGGRAVLVKELTSKGASVIEVAAYESKCPEKIDIHVWNALQHQKIDIVTFASSKTVSNFCQLVEQELKGETSLNDVLQGVAIASIGPQTSKTCHELLGRVDIEAEIYTLEGLTKAISDSCTA
ncbi:uroporphyrin-III C-methyltransferase [Xenococcus sp. PCC 7305]|uniref:uroporphyrinogen-III C-methyltransferase n=1 Tax=Xenococcus sp. PCC 7305 TaxID=102125 RepID=UPI0002AC7548|nr:uroporphyrinogen-III C-methyltransferase [Xenococcus sp. PCC 7305]ELS01703.1 uroporphyrin-III C-methyltransferase [Xenococcus sp. PCC 7305]